MAWLSVLPGSVFDEKVFQFLLKIGEVLQLLLNSVSFQTYYCEHRIKFLTDLSHIYCACYL